MTFSFRPSNQGHIFVILIFANFQQKADAILHWAILVYKVCGYRQAFSIRQTPPNNRSLPFLVLAFLVLVLPVTPIADSVNGIFLQKNGRRKYLSQNPCQSFLKCLEKTI